MRERTNFARPCHVRSPESSGINDDACVAKCDSARPALPNDYDRLLSSALLLLTRFRTPRDSFDLPPRPPISKRTTAGCIAVDMSPLIEEENSSGINRGYKSRGTNTEWRRSRDDASFGKRSTHVRNFVLCNRSNDVPCH